MRKQSRDKIPKREIKKFHMQIGSSVNVEYENGKGIIDPILTPKKYNIYDLVKYLKAKDKQEEIDWGKTEGNEIWLKESLFLKILILQELLWWIR